jgi:hypothetical protein
MVDNEKDMRLIGYGSMLLEGLVAVCALIAAASLPQGDYWAINIDMSKAHQYAETLAKMNADVDHLDQIEAQVGGETLRGRTGGAVTLAVGMAQIMTQAFGMFSSGSVDSLVKYWFHFRKYPSEIPADGVVAGGVVEHCIGDFGLGQFDLVRFDRHDLADVWDRQSVARGDRFVFAHDMAVPRGARSLCLGDDFADAFCDHDDFDGRGADDSNAVLA